MAILKKLLEIEEMFEKQFKEITENTTESYYDVSYLSHWDSDNLLVQELSKVEVVLEGSVEDIIASMQKIKEVKDKYAGEKDKVRVSVSDGYGEACINVQVLTVEPSELSELKKKGEINSFIGMVEKVKKFETKRIENINEGLQRNLVDIDPEIEQNVRHSYARKIALVQDNLDYADKLIEQFESFLPKKAKMKP